MSTPSHDDLLVRPFLTVLVANRGEIAVRVIASARAAGYRTVAVHSDADVAAPHVHAADGAVRIGPAAARESYLDIDAVIAAARKAGADAIHPGYGFLAENAAFARACAQAGIVFIGPPPAAIDAMGDKAAAKRLVADAGVPLLPGYQGEAQDEETLLARAAEVGFPLMVKAAAGGGGKGMRLVHAVEDLPEAIAGARREALGAFGSDVLLLERALLAPRHVEVQILADAHGHVIALGERDCSVQRRHQKVVEEAPAPGVAAEVRAAMHAAAVAAAQAVGYVGAGTVEFLLDPDDGTFAFLEMNTRLQVEHPVTELVTGLDLVDWQLRIAAGERLDIQQPDVIIDGHAIEVRLYAEDPSAGYLPQTGVVLAWHPPSGPGIRVDAGIATGGTVSAHYDPMLAKLIAHGRDREEARRRLLRAVESTVLLGVRTNRAFLAAVLADKTFAAAGVTTAFLTQQDLASPAPVRAFDVAVVAGWLHLQREAEAAGRSPGLAGWSSSGRRRSRQRLRISEATFDVHLERTRAGLTVTVHAPPSSGDSSPADAASTTAPSPPPTPPSGDSSPSTAGWGQAMTVTEAATKEAIIVDGQTIRLTARRVGDHRVLARLAHIDLDVLDVLHAPAADSDVVGAGVLTAPMHGAVVAAPVGIGDTVTAGDPVVVIEAMKMEHVVTADVDGVIEEVASVGAQVADRQVVARISTA